MAPTLIAAAAISLAGFLPQAVITYQGLEGGRAPELALGVPVGAFGMSQSVGGAVVAQLRLDARACL